MIQDKKPFCWAPWVSLTYNAIRHGGSAEPCCEWRGNQTSPKNFFQGSATEYLKSDWLKNIKQVMLNHDMSVISKTCEECIIEESVGNNSSRMDYHNNIKNGEWSTEGLHFLDFRPGNTCNLKCRMCSAPNSSMIEEEQGLNLYSMDVSDITKLDFSNIKVIKILGGEPSIDPKVSEFLDYLEKNFYRPDDVIIRMTTNCTNVNSKWLDRLSKWNKVSLNFSIDATGNIVEYIRSGCKWSVLERNIEILKKHSWKWQYNVTTGMYNFPVIEKWLPYFIENIQEVDIINEKYKESKIVKTSMGPEDVVTYMSIITPHALSLKALPDEIKNEKLEWLSGFKSNYVEKIINVFNQYNYDPLYLEKFKKFTTEYDKLRGTNIHDLDPIFTRLMEWKT